MNFLIFFLLEGGVGDGRLFEVGRLKSTFLGVDAYSRLGVYKLFLLSGWALIRGGPLFEIGYLVD